MPSPGSTMPSCTTGVISIPTVSRFSTSSAWSPRARSFLMDRETLLVHTDHRFNASADLTARGSKQNTRGVADYVRGAWSETNDEAEQSKTRYLRGGMPTWSAVGATYDDGLGAVTTAVVVKWFTGVEVDGSSLSTMYQLHDGNFELREARRITRCPASRPVDIRPIFGEYYVDPDRVRAVHHLTAGDHGRRDHMAPVRDGCGVPVPQVLAAHVDVRALERAADLRSVDEEGAPTGAVAHAGDLDERAGDRLAVGRLGDPVVPVSARPAPTRRPRPGRRARAGRRSPWAARRRRELCGRGRWTIPASGRSIGCQDGRSLRTSIDDQPATPRTGDEGAAGRPRRPARARRCRP